MGCFNYCSPLCPITAILHAMSFTAKNASPCTHVFAFYSPATSSNGCFTYRSFLTKLKTCISSMGLKPDLYAGHSFRRGGALHAFQA